MTTSRDPNSAHRRPARRSGRSGSAARRRRLRTPTPALPTRDASRSSGTRLGSNWSDVKHYQLLALGNRSLTERREGGLHAVAAARFRGHDGDESAFAAEVTSVAPDPVPGANSQSSAGCGLSSTVVRVGRDRVKARRRRTHRAQHRRFRRAMQTSLPSPNAEDREVSDVVVDVAKEVPECGECGLFTVQSTDNALLLPAGGERSLGRATILPARWNPCGRESILVERRSFHPCPRRPDSGRA